MRQNVRCIVADGPGIHTLRRFRNFSRARQWAKKMSRAGGSYYVFLAAKSDTAVIGFRAGKLDVSL